MQKKKKIKKQTSSNLKKRKRIFVNFTMPTGIGSGKPAETFLIEAKHLQRGLDVLYANAPPHSKAAKAITMKLQEVLRYNKMNWLGFILFAETLGINAGKAYGLLGNHFSSKEIQKHRVKFLNQTMIKVLLKKIDQWSGVPKAWKNHRAYIDSWCRKTGTPLFKSLSNFQDLVTAWKDATVGKRGWRSIAKEMNIDSSGDKEFNIHNKPPKSLN